MVALGLLHLDVGNNVGVEDGRYNVHLFNFKVVIARKSEEDAECGVTDGRSKYGRVVNDLHVASGDKADLVLDDIPGTLTLDLVLPRASEDAHGRSERNEMPCVLGREGGELLIGGKEPVGLSMALHSLFVWARLSHWQGGGRRIRSGRGLCKSTFAAGTGIDDTANGESILIGLLSSRNSRARRWRRMRENDMMRRDERVGLKVIKGSEKLQRFPRVNRWGGRVYQSTEGKRNRYPRLVRGNTAKANDPIGRRAID